MEDSAAALVVVATTEDVAASDDPVTGAVVSLGPEEAPRLVESPVTGISVPP